MSAKQMVTAPCGHRLHTVKGHVPEHDDMGHKLPTRTWMPLDPKKSYGAKHLARNARQKNETRNRCVA